MNDVMLERFHLDTKLHEQALSHAYEKGMRLNDINVFFQPECWDILTELIEREQYVTPPCTQYYIDKLSGNNMTYQQARARDGKDVREINVLPFMDRVIWNTFYKILYDRFEYLIHPLCVSYRKGEGTGSVAKKLKNELVRMGHYKGVKGDLNKFFDSVPIEQIDLTFNMMMELEPSKIWKPIVDCYHNDYVYINGELVEKYTSLRQGNPLGCLLADLILRDIDAEMTKYDVVYYRYSDDFILIGREYEKAFNRFQEMLNEKGIILNQKKTTYISNYSWFEFLGFSFKGTMISVSKKTLTNLENEIKIRTVSKTRQAHKPATKKELKKMIKDLQYYFFTAFAKSQENFGMGVYLFGTVNVERDLRALEDYCKDCLRAAYTNKSNIYGLGYVNRNGYVIDNCNLGQNVKANREKTQSVNGDILKDCGWVSLIKMYNDYHTNIDLFENSVFRMCQGTI